MKTILNVVLVAARVRARGSSLAVVLCLGLYTTPAHAGGAVDATVATKTANQFCNGIRLQDEIVVVNTRNVCGSCDPDSLRTGIKVENYAVTDEMGHRKWQKSDLENFLSFDPTVTTVIYVHGNQMTAWDAKCQGLALYRRLANYAGDSQRIRYVIFSWPSAKASGLLRDVRIKAVRTNSVGCQLAWLLSEMPAETPVSLIGFSFGARVITGGLHVLAGGDLNCGLHLEQRTDQPRSINAVLIASAVHSHWLGEGKYHGLAMTQVDHMFLLNNCQDLALRYYHLSTSDHSRPRALGISGPTWISSEYAAKIRKRDVSRYAGSEHDLFAYLCAPGATAQVWQHAVEMHGAGIATAAN